jgi:hypothetical protein
MIDPMMLQGARTSQCGKVRVMWLFANSLGDEVDCADDTSTVGEFLDYQGSGVDWMVRYTP